MIIKKLETYIILIKPKDISNVALEVKEELQLKAGFQNSRIIQIKRLSIDDAILGNENYLLDYSDYVPVQVTTLKII
jgi:hypothetical protein